MTTNDATGPRSDATEPTRGLRSHDERRDGTAGDSDTTTTGDVAVDLDSTGVDTASSDLAVRLHFWKEGSSALETDEIRLE